MNLFFELIRLAIGTQEGLSHCPTPQEWMGAYKEAQRNSMTGICYAGMLALPNEAWPDRVLKANWQHKALWIQEYNRTLNGQCAKLQDKLKRAGFRSYIMKGQAVGSLYRSNGRVDLSLLRQTGDIDVLVEGGFRKVMNLVQSLLPTDKWNELEIEFRCFDDTLVEVHYRPMIMRHPLRNRRLQRFFEGTAEGCFDNSVRLSVKEGDELAWVEIKAGTLEFNIVHQLVHTFLHLFTEGIGMRQMLDYYFVLMACEDLEATKIQPIVKRLGLRRYASGMLWLMREVFGMAEPDMARACDILGVTPNEHAGRLLLGEVMRGGNFGRFDDRKDVSATGIRRIWNNYRHNARLLYFDRWAWFWDPLWRVYQKGKRVIRG